MSAVLLACLRSLVLQVSQLAEAVSGRIDDIVAATSLTTTQVPRASLAASLPLLDSPVPLAHSLLTASSLLPVVALPASTPVLDDRIYICMIVSGLV